MMNDDEIAELEDESTWNLESAERQSAPRSARRAVVSVGFRSEEFVTVADAARAARQPVSQFIRNAALEKAQGQGVETRTIVLTHADINVGSILVHEVTESTLKHGAPQLRRRMLAAG
jgi:uncharacterized protein (DUF1778 family)